MTTKDDLYLLPTATLRAQLAPLDMLRRGKRTELADRLWAAINVYDNEYNSDEEDWENTEREALITECHARGLRIKGAPGDMRSRIRRDHNRRKQYAVAPTPSAHRISKRPTGRRPLPSPRTPPSPSRRCRCSCRCGECECNGPPSSVADTVMDSDRTYSLRTASDVFMEDLTGNSQRTFSLRTPSDTDMEDATAANSQRTNSLRTASDVVMGDQELFTTYRERTPSFASDETDPFPGFDAASTLPMPPPTPPTAAKCCRARVEINEPGPSSRKRRRSDAGLDDEEEHGRPRRSRRLENQHMATNDAPLGGLGISYELPRTNHAATSASDSPSPPPIDSHRACSHLGCHHTRAAPYYLRRRVVPVSHRMCSPQACHHARAAKSRR